MIFGRPQNLVVAAFASLFNVIVLVLASAHITLEPALIAAVNLAAGSLIAVIAFQPPTLNPGDTFITQTPKGQPNFTTTVATPPAADKPPVPTPDGGK